MTSNNPLLRLYVGNISFSTTSEHLQVLFSEVGNVLSAKIVSDRFSGRSLGFGFVEMASSDEVRRAESELRGRLLDGRAIIVAPAKSSGASSVQPRQQASNESKDPRPMPDGINSDRSENLAGVRDHISERVIAEVLEQEDRFALRGDAKESSDD